MGGALGSGIQLYVNPETSGGGVINVFMPTGSDQRVDFNTYCTAQIALGLPAIIFDPNGNSLVLVNVQAGDACNQLPWYTTTTIASAGGPLEVSIGGDSEVDADISGDFAITISGNTFVSASRTWDVYSVYLEDVTVSIYGSWNVSFMQFSSGSNKIFTVENSAIVKVDQIGSVDAGSTINVCGNAIFEAQVCVAGNGYYPVSVNLSQDNGPNAIFVVKNLSADNAGTDFSAITWTVKSSTGSNFKFPFVATTTSKSPTLNIGSSNTDTINNSIIESGSLNVLNFVGASSYSQLKINGDVNSVNIDSTSAGLSYQNCFFNFFGNVGNASTTGFTDNSASGYKSVIFANAIFTMIKSSGADFVYKINLLDLSPWVGGNCGAFRIDAATLIGGGTVSFGVNQLNVSDLVLSGTYTISSNKIDIGSVGSVVVVEFTGIATYGCILNVGNAQGAILIGSMDYGQINIAGSYTSLTMQSSTSNCVIISKGAASYINAGTGNVKLA